MMENRTDKNLYTIIFAIVMVVVVGGILAFLSSSLKPAITQNQKIEKQQNILYALGVNNNDGSAANFIDANLAPDLFDKTITEQIVIVYNNGKVSNTYTREQYLKQFNKEPYLIDVKKQQDLQKTTGERHLPLIIGKSKQGETLYVAPIRGKGLWDAIWGYVAVNKDMVVQGAYFDHKTETPGLGANIKERFFMDDFIGEHLMSDDGAFKGITVAKGNADPKNERKKDHKVDAIAGATITGDGVTKMIKSDFGLYVPYFKTLKN